MHRARRTTPTLHEAGRRRGGPAGMAAGAPQSVRSRLWPCREGDGNMGVAELHGLTIGMMKQLKIIVEKHADGYVTYPVGIKGVVVGQGDSYEEALSDVRSAIHSHVLLEAPRYES